MKYLDNFFNISSEKAYDLIFSKVKIGILEVTFPSGRKRKFIGSNDEIYADITLNNYSLLPKLLKKGSIALADSYIENDFSTSNLSRLLLFAKYNEKSYNILIKGKSIYNFFRKIQHHFNENTKRKSKKNIKYHYDLGNDFYQKWLDDTMTYSSAIFDNKQKNLMNAQINKYKKIINSSKINENTTLLEIGCGWGGFSTFVAKNIGAKVNAITISKKQYEYFSNEIQKEGLGEKINLELKDYRDINNSYDQITSIEMFEAVGKKYWPIFFEKITKSLNNNGSAAIQVITIDEKRALNYQNNPDFIQKYIFPGGILPSKNQLFDLCKASNLKINELSSFGESYAKTLKIWNKDFQKSWEEISRMGFTNKFKRMWEYYFCYCETGFITHSTDVSQLILKKNI
ncbi:MAG: Tuberculostearic acid methyltransferase UfaA1 [Alphaproteobacteria bacterium MarineAlpha5_Bin9]|nr:MAG: Tuberculostearic acid methyltransferase UfaA1 [Alphaproteobacteria bacterium MarineAlpha5_Bin9]|tara:strand:+ start:6329 stop:7528 length:1200 start_codon:yes stop_codon:yes gene_type:complete